MNVFSAHEQPATGVCFSFSEKSKKNACLQREALTEHGKD
jgi:hypothetical protein